MSDKEGRFSLRRWSERKLAATQMATQTATPSAPVPPFAPAADAATVPNAAAPAAAAPLPLPPTETLTFESDFTAFLAPRVAESIKRAALSKLFHDPRFNVMDGLDVYIDDYSLPSPLDPEVARQLVQGRYVFDPPATRVAPDGTVEDVPEAPAAVEIDAADGEERVLVAEANAAVPDGVDPAAPPSAAVPPAPSVDGADDDGRAASADALPAPEDDAAASSPAPALHPPQPVPASRA